MAPYAPSNSTLAPSGTTPPLPPHDHFYPRSLSTTVVSGIPTSVAQKFPIMMTDKPLSNSGVGPLILQPSPTVAVNSVDSSGSSHLAYLAILAIPIVGGVVTFVLMRRRKKQKPAKRSPPPPLTLRNETIRARPDVESPLPRDRIRAMNSIYRDTEVPPSPAPEFHIFSPRPPSPPQNEHPQPLGNHFASLSIPGSSEPPTPLTDSTTSASEFTSCPPTPCTPGFPATMPTSQPEPLHVEDEDNEEARFTWDFRCKGITNRSSSAVLESGVVTFDGPVATDVKRTDDQGTPYEGTRDTFSATTVGSEAPNSNVATMEDDPPSKTQEKSKSVANKDGISVIKSLASINPDTFPLDFNTSAPKTLTQSDSRFSTASGLTVLDLRLDITSFSSEVIAALSGPHKDLPVKKNEDVTSAPVPKDRKAEPSAKITRESKEPKKRLVLSKPNHRILAPTSPSLKVNTTFTFDYTRLPGSLLYPPDAAHVHASIGSLEIIRAIHHQRREVQLEVGRKRSSSEADIDDLKKARLLQAGGAVDQSNAGVPVKSSEAAISGPVISGTKTEAENASHSEMLKTSLSVPVAFELVSLS